MNPQKQYHIVEVTWVDSETGEHGWTDFNKAEETYKTEIPFITTVGYLYFENKDKLVLVQNIDVKNKKVLNRMSIPTCCILDTKKIRVAKL